MESVSLPTLAAEQLKAACAARSGRAAHTIYGGSEHTLRQTLVALAAGQELAEHESPPEATLQVISGTVRLDSADQTWQGVAGDLVPIPPERHSLVAVEEAVVLLTVASPR